MFLGRGQAYLLPRARTGLSPCMTCRGPACLLLRLRASLVPRVTYRGPACLLPRSWASLLLCVTCWGPARLFSRSRTSLLLHVSCRGLTCLLPQSGTSLSLRAGSPNCSVDTRHSCPTLLSMPMALQLSPGIILLIPRASYFAALSIFFGLVVLATQMTSVTMSGVFPRADNPNYRVASPSIPWAETQTIQR